MKTTLHITAITTVLFLGFVTLNGQTYKRSETRDRKERVTVKKTEARQTTVEPKRQHTARTVQSTLKRQTTVAPKRQQPVRTRPVSISTPRNPRSDYRAPENRRHMKNNKYSEKRYYGVNYYHHVYPKRHIKTNYHHNTYVHHYNVLYYPTHHEIFWTRNMYRDYRNWYPDYRWRYNYGYRIQTLSIFDVKYNLGEVAMVYGRVYATWHNRETDDYLLFFGGDYPAQQFTVVLPGHVARRYSWRPERYFLGEHMTVTGLITTFDGIPEIIVKNKRQVGIY